MQAFASQVRALNNQALVMYANVIHGHTDFSKVNKAEVVASLSAACDHQFKPAANSIVVLDSGRVAATVRAIMVPAVDILPVESASSMTSISKNMFMDGQDNMWTLRESESGNVIVRALQIDDPEELVDMMSSCSSASAANVADPMIKAAINKYEGDLGTVQGGDFVSFFSSESASIVGGIVVAEVEDNGETNLLCLSTSGNHELVDRASIVSYVSGDEIEYPEDVKVSVSASTDANRLIQYYKKVLGYNPAYFAKLSAIILGHSFA